MFWTTERVVVILAVTAWAATMIFLLYVVDLYQRRKQYRILDNPIDITQDLKRLNRKRATMTDEQIPGKQPVNRICPHCGGTNVVLKHNIYGLWFSCKDCLAFSSGFAETIDELEAVWPTKPREAVVKQTGE